MHRKVAVAIAAALAVVVAGCGGTETTTLDKAALVRRVEVACREAQEASSRKAREAPGSAGSPNAIKALEVGQKIFVERLEGLAGSGSVKADFDTYKDAVRSRYDLIQRVASADRADQSRVMRSVQRDAERVTRRVEASARDVGLRGCF